MWNYAGLRQVAQQTKVGCKLFYTPLVEKSRLHPSWDGSDQ